MHLAECLRGYRAAESDSFCQFGVTARVTCALRGVDSNEQDAGISNSPLEPNPFVFCGRNLSKD